MKKNHLIFMADIVRSRVPDQKMLMENFKKVTDSINVSNKKYLLSPLTITLGDEFQGIIKNLESAIQIILDMEEKMIHENSGFQLRYVLYEGQIDTPINPEIAYGMLGDGLTKAREALGEMKNSGMRFYFNLSNKELTKALHNSMLIFQGLTDDWKIGTNHLLISSLIKHKDYKIVSEELGKTRSQIWKRKKNLKIDEYFALKELITFITTAV